MQENVKTQKSGRRGHSIIELSLALPWFLLLGAGTLDAGYYAYALISTESAARVAAAYTSGSSSTAADSTAACSYVLDSLKMAPNVGSGVTTCTSLPVQVTAQSIAGPDGETASQVSVTYQTVPLIPIPGLLTKQLTFTRTVKMRLRG